ncbi:hypothetical protein V6N13_040686 [Hibiscus sabdariffa]
MIELLQKSWSMTDTTPSLTNEKDRCFRHMMNERSRSEATWLCIPCFLMALRWFPFLSLSLVKLHKWSLHYLVPLLIEIDGFKWQNDKNSRVRELEWLKKDLERRNRELQENLGENCREENKIRVKIENPKSGIDSMLEALKCLKALDSKPRMIQSTIHCGHWF